MEFDTFDSKKSDDYVSIPGTPYLEEYEYKVNDKGEKKLIKTDKKTDVHARIQADADSCDINKLMLRFTLGDESAINVRSGEFIDVTKMPTTLAELFDRATQAEQVFEKLPTDLKEMFNNSPSEFFSQFDTKEFNEKIDKYNDRFVNNQYEEQPKSDDGIKEIEHE